jgi:hypothetical protein
VLDLSLRGSGPVRREAVGVVLGCKDNVLYVERYGSWVMQRQWYCGTTNVIIVLRNV